MEGAQGVLTSKTVVGEPITVGDTIIIPLSDVSIGVGAGSNGAERKDGGMGGFSAKMVPSAVLVIKNNITKVVNVRDQTSLTHIMDMIPEVIDKIRSRNTEMISDEDAVNTAFPDKNKKRDYILSAIWLFLCFLCGFSRGLFPLITGILPIAGAYYARDGVWRTSLPVTGTPYQKGR